MELNQLQKLGCGITGCGLTLILIGLAVPVLFAIVLLLMYLVSSD